MPARGDIHGRVVNAASKAPITGATVDVVSLPAATGAPAGRAATIADGTFRVLGLRDGRYRVTVRALGFRPQELPVVTISASTREILWSRVSGDVSSGPVLNDTEM